MRTGYFARCVNERLFDEYRCEAMTTDAPRWILERMQLTVNSSILEQLLHHAAFAAHLVGHLDDNPPPDLIHKLGDHVDAIVHGLTELLGDPQILAAPDAAASDDRKVRDGAPTLMSSTGGTP
jgi:hypothetical protein